MEFPWEILVYIASHLLIFLDKINVLKIGSITESKKLPIHDLLVQPVVEPQLNR